MASQPGIIFHVFYGLFMTRAYVISFVLLALLATTVVRAQERYFYSGKTFGSEAMYNPLSVIINGGFDVLQASTHSRSVSVIPFHTGFDNVWRNITDPFPQISRFGWNRFVNQEVFPTSLKIDQAQYFPNYTLHLIGGGMEYRATREWFDYNGASVPTLWALTTMVVYHLLNETIENDAVVGPNVDPIADMLIFDPAGILLFMDDDVAEFFSTKLHLTDWSGQAAYGPQYQTIENHGQSFVMKYVLPFAPSTSIFYHFGDSGMLGLSFARQDGTAISVSGGVATKEIRAVDMHNGARTVSVSLGWMAGIFYDRDNSLLASLVLSNRANEALKLNIYPGIIRFGSFSPGLFCGLGGAGQFTAGMAFRFSPVGLAFRSTE
ncbi:MAG: hypothetical protein NTV54_09050 [Ignavibacteriales bacterium]|nr:hypothetical protein [Ignavibacteriales bacterium]